MGSHPEVYSCIIFWRGQCLECWKLWELATFGFFHRAPRKGLRVDLLWNFKRLFFQEKNPLILEENTWNRRIWHLFLHWLGRKDMKGISWKRRSSSEKNRFFHAWRWLLFRFSHDLYTFFFMKWWNRSANDLEMSFRIPHHFWLNATTLSGLTNSQWDWQESVRFLFSWWWWVCKSLGDCTDQLMVFVDLGLATSVFTSNSKRCSFSKQRRSYFYINMRDCETVRLIFWKTHISYLPVFFPVFVFLWIHLCFSPLFFTSWTF